MKPNIFNYATSELSQDAVLCWLVACVECDDASLQKLGKEFICFLYESASGKKTNLAEVRGLTKIEHSKGAYPWKQYCKIDVFFEADIGGETYSFIIEDKTGTQIHGNQLKKHSDAIAKDKLHEGKMLRIYFKTGYVFGDEKKKAEDAEYAVIDLDAFVLFLGRFENIIEHDVFKDYFSYVYGKKQRTDKILAEVKVFHSSETKKYCEIFRHNFAQWQTMQSLKKVVQNTLAELKKQSVADIKNDGCMERGKNRRGGEAYTRFWWYSSRGKFQNESIVEHLFWRLDAKNQLRLRYGVWANLEVQYDGFVEAKTARVEQYREIFAEVGKAIFGDALSGFRKRIGDTSPIGKIHFNSAHNSVPNILDRMPKFHQEFIEKCISQNLW